MKLFILIIFLLCSNSLSSNELSWVDTQIEAIKPARKGMNEAELNKIKDPFIFYKNRNKKNYVKSRKKPVKYFSASKSTTSSETSNDMLKQQSKHLVLSAIINKSALINAKWYKLGEHVGSFKLSSMNRTSVVLVKGSAKLVLRTGDTKRNIKFK